MSTTILLYDPTAPQCETASDAQPASRALGAVGALAGKVVGFIDNSKPNFAHLVDDLAQVLVARFGVARIVRHQKPAASMPAGGDVLEALARECDLVIAGSGD